MAGGRGFVDPRPAAAMAPAAGSATAPAEPAGVRPIVALPRSGPSGLLFAIVLVVAAIILFMMLDSRRRSLSAPAVTAATPGLEGMVSAPPPLFIPPVSSSPPPSTWRIPMRVVVASTPAPAARRALNPAPIQPAVTVGYVPQPSPPSEAPASPAPASSSTVLVLDTTVAPLAPQPSDSKPEAASPLGALGGIQATGRVRSAMFANKSTTVVQGTLIPAVLETAFDSTRPGLARALVSRDVRGFDGTRVLVPRGSRVTGEYRSDVHPGQKRAMINWTRLIRPDGITIELASPASDPLGRGGVRGHYDSHFWERFGGAILQSVLDVGVNLASRAASRDVIVALPGSTQALSPSLLQSAQPVPTVTVPAGTSVSVFVARDLDFSSAERAQ